jgi:hypothetical protein
MLVLGIAMVAALLVPLLTHGSYRRLLATKVHWGWLLGGGLAIQIVLEYASPPRRYWHDVGFGLLVASYVLVLAFCARNLVLRGMSIVLIGIACNALVIVANQGMPVTIPPDWNPATNVATVKHHPQQPGERLLILSDFIVVNEPLNTVLSYGDLILAVGLCDVAYNASRDPQRRRRKARRALQARAASAPPPPVNGNGNGVTPASARHAETTV